MSENWRRTAITGLNVNMRFVLHLRPGLSFTWPGHDFLLSENVAPVAPLQPEAQP